MLFFLYIALFIISVFILWHCLTTNSVNEAICRNVRLIPLENMLFMYLSGRRYELAVHKALAQTGSSQVFAAKVLGNFTLYVADPVVAEQVLSRQFSKFSRRRVS